MRSSLWGILVFAAGIGLAGAAPAKEAPPESYTQALELVHAFSGAGDELQRARQIAQELSVSHRDKGYAETIQAELLSTWNLNMHGGPQELFDEIIALTDRALRLNPDLPHAHVARARTLIRASKYEEAGTSLTAALKLHPSLSGAFFLQGEIYRRKRQVADAEIWYLKFIDATASPARKSNGYYWLGTTYQAAAWDQPRQWDDYIAKAKGAFEKGVALAPGGAWTNVNFAIFLNNEGEDFAGAERYARKALEIMEFPMARYQLAIARYQKLLSMNMSDGSLKLLVADIARSSGVPFEKALAFSEQYDSYAPMRNRLGKIRDRMSRPAN